MRFLVLLLLVACAPKSGDTLPDNAHDAVLTYGEIVVATYADSQAGVVALNATLAALLADPSQAALDSARAAWIDAREPYLQSEVFRFYEGPIDNAADGPEG